MTNQEVIARLEDIRKMCPSFKRSSYPVVELKEALDMATNIISALDKIKGIVNFWVYDKDVKSEISDAYCDLLDLIDKYTKGENE